MIASVRKTKENQLEFCDDKLVLVLKADSSDMMQSIY